jgi:lactoylglutathione lyase
LAPAKRCLRSDEGLSGIGHVAIRVKAVARTLEFYSSRLAERGISLTQGKKVGADGNLQAWIEDPDGNRIELMQMAPDSLQLEAINRLSGGVDDLAAR